MKKGAALASRPRNVAVSLPLLARALGRGFRRFHLPLHFRLDGVEVEARATLHRREFKESLDFLADQLLDEDEAPELELGPVEILLAALLGSVVRPAGALERIE